MALLPASRRVLSNNSLSGPLPELRGAPALEELYLDVNQFNGSLPQSWSTLQSLRHLSVAGNAVSGLLPLTWGALQNLYTIDLSGNRISGAFRADQANLSDRNSCMPELQPTVT